MTTVRTYIIFRGFKSNIEKVEESLLKQRVNVYKEMYAGRESPDNNNMDENMDVEEEEEEDAIALQRERVEMVRISGSGLRADEAPVITRFFDDQEYMCVINQFPENCPIVFDLLYGDISTYSTDSKIKFLYTILYQMQENSSERLDQMIRNLEEKMQMKEELEAVYRAECISGMKVVGITITGASINNAMLKILKPEIVLVEEAAEILEPQLLVALSYQTKHLIMIGDHNQLPPQVNTYELKKMRFDVSMMQRLVDNNLPFVQLQMQNRMRPDIAELLLDIYPTLKSNISRVGSIELPKILKYSTIFWAHNSLEDGETDKNIDRTKNIGRSKTNKVEVSMAVGLASVLITYGHRPSDITILTMYLGQVSEFRRVIKNNKNLTRDDETVNISTVDNFQGDENKIVIVSLVRSNTAGKVGFLAELPRRCVAQSRAKSCVVFIGNPETVRRARCWESLLKKVQFNGPYLEISCPNHSTSSTQKLSSGKDAERYVDNPSLLCSIPCGLLYSCGKHTCTATCQPEHKHNKCITKVSFNFSRCDHVGTKPCWKDVSKELCMTVIDFNFPDCGHPEKR